MPWAEGLVLQHSAFLKHAPDLTRASIFNFFFIDSGATDSNKIKSLRWPANLTQIPGLFMQFFVVHEKAHKYDIHSFLKRYRAFGGLAVNWRVCGPLSLIELSW